MCRAVRVLLLARWKHSAAAPGSPVEAEAPALAALRLVGAVLLEMNDDWAVVRRYMTFEVPTVKEVDPNDTKRIIEAMKKSA